VDVTRGATALLISHRFSSVRHADNIVVIAEGKVIEQGSHEELLAAEGRYAELFHLQAERFTEEEGEEVNDADIAGDADRSDTRAETDALDAAQPEAVR